MSYLPGFNYDIFISYAHDDIAHKGQRFAFKLADLLADQGLDVEITKESRDPVQTMRNFEEHSKYVNSLIIMFGDVTPNWVLGHLKKR